MLEKPTFRIKVLANNIQWRSFQAKLAAVAAFYASKCELTFEVVETSLLPIFTTYDDLAPLSIVNRDWYDENVARPYAGSADIVVLVLSPEDHIRATPIGVMTFHNVGPWEITIFALGENDHTYMQGTDMGNSFVLYLEHELSHIFYRYCNERDDTHVHFPVAQNPYTDYPANVLADFDFTQQYPVLEYLKEKLLQALVNLNVIAKQTTTVH